MEGIEPQRRGERGVAQRRDATLPGAGERNFLRHSMARLFRGFEIGAHVVRTRVQDVNEVMAINDYSRKAGFDLREKQERAASFRAAANWSEFRG